MQTPFHQSSTHRATARLARFDGQEFVPIGEGEVHAAFVHVFVHGWQPGYWLRERYLALSDGVEAVPAWDRRLVDATGRPLIDDYLPLLEALAKLGGDHEVLWYSWLDESATQADIFQAHRSRQATQVNGRRLAESLQLALAGPGSATEHRSQRVHLIGHSHGSAVATHAAVSMMQPPDQLTLLDAPEDSLSRVAGASDLIGAVLPRLRPVRSGRGTFVDSYATVFGRPYHGRVGLESVVDVLLAPPLTLGRDPMRTIGESHLYPVEWYARSVRESMDAGARVGYAWSPLASGDPASLHSWYHAPLPQRPMVLHRHFAEPIDSAASRFIRRRPEPTRVAAGVRLDLNAATPRAVAAVTSESGDLLIEFDLQVRGQVTSAARLEIDLDQMAAFVSRPLFPVPASGRYLLLVDGHPGEHLIAARLVGAEGDLTVGIVNVRLVRGEKNATRFTLSRSAAAIFVSGAAAGSLATLAAVGAGAVAVKQVGAVLRAGRGGD